MSHKNELKDIKFLKSQIQHKKAQYEILNSEVADKQRDLNSKMIKIRALEDQLLELQSDKKLRVSEHAIVRYFERVLGYDISKIKQDILSEEVRILVSKLGGNGTYPNGDLKVCMKNYTVTTVVK